MMWRCLSAEDPCEPEPSPCFDLLVSRGIVIEGGFHLENKYDLLPIFIFPLELHVFLGETGGEDS